MDYSIAVSTASGLFGYLIGDLVQFQSDLPPPDGVRGPNLGRALAHPGADLVRRDRARAWRQRCARPRARWWSSRPARRWASREPGRAATRSSSSSTSLRRNPHRFARAVRREPVRAEPRLPGAPHGGRRHPAARPVRPASGGARRFMEDIGRRSPQQKFPRVVEKSKRDILVKIMRHRSPGSVHEPVGSLLRRRGWSRGQHGDRGRRPDEARVDSAHRHGHGDRRSAADPRVRSTGRPGLRRLGHPRREHLRGCASAHRAPSTCSARSSRSCGAIKPWPGVVSPKFLGTADAQQRGHRQGAPRGAGAPHPEHQGLQGGEQAGPADHRQPRLDRAAHRGRRRPPHRLPPSRPASPGTTTGSGRR